MFDHELIDTIETMSDHKPAITPPLTSPPAKPQHALIAWLALALAALPIGHVLAAALDHPLALSVVLTVARYGLLLGIGLLLRPLLPKVAIAASAGLRK